MGLPEWPEDWLEYKDSEIARENGDTVIAQFPIPEHLRKSSIWDVPHGVGIIKLDDKYSGVIVYGYLHEHFDGSPRRQWISNYGERIAIRMLLEELGIYPQGGDAP